MGEAVGEDRSRSIVFLDAATRKLAESPKVLVTNAIAWGNILMS